MSDKARILAWAYRQEFSPGVLNIQDILRSAVQEALERPQLEAESFASVNERRYWNYFRESADRDRRRGVAPLFEFIEASTYRIRWTPCALSRCSEKKSQKRGVALESRPRMLQVLDGLNSREYEVANCLIGELAGGSKMELTPRGDEGGVDFFMMIPLPGRCHLFAGGSGPMRVVGQTKKHSRPLEASGVRDFITTIDNVRKQEPSVERLVPAWFRSTPGPMVGWITAHRGFQSGARRLAKNHGIVISDSVDLAEIAALARRWSRWSDPGVRAEAFYHEVRAVRDNLVGAVEQ